MTESKTAGTAEPEAAEDRRSCESDRLRSSLSRLFGRPHLRSRTTVDGRMSMGESCAKVAFSSGPNERLRSLPRVISSSSRPSLTHVTMRKSTIKEGVSESTFTLSLHLSPARGLNPNMRINALKERQVTCMVEFFHSSPARQTWVLLPSPSLFISVSLQTVSIARSYEHTNTTIHDATPALTFLLTLPLFRRAGL